MIPLFRLDLLAIEEILSYLDPMNLFNLSLLSKRATIIAKAALKKRKASCYNLDICIQDCPQVHFTEKFVINKDFVASVENTIGYIHFKESKKLNEEFYKTSFKGLSLTLTCNNLRVGFKNIINHLLTFFTPGIKYFKYAGRHDILIDTIENFESQMIQVGSLDLQMGNVNSDQQVCAVLDKLPIFKLVSIDNLNPSEELIRTDFRLYELSKLSFGLGSWVTLPRLLTMDCEVLHVRESQLTTSEYTFLFNFWIQGGMGRMKILNMYVEHLDMEEIFKGVPHEKNLHRDIESRILGRCPQDNYTIRRVDGVMACVFSTGSHIPGIEKRGCWFEMQVLYS